MNVRKSLVVWWLGLSALTSGALGLIPVLGTKIPQAMQPKKEKANLILYVCFFQLSFALSALKLFASVCFFNYSFQSYFPATAFRGPHCTNVESSLLDCCFCSFSYPWWFLFDFKKYSSFLASNSWGNIYCTCCFHFNLTSCIKWFFCYT